MYFLKKEERHMDGDISFHPSSCKGLMRFRLSSTLKRPKTLIKKKTFQNGFKSWVRWKRVVFDVDRWKHRLLKWPHMPPKRIYLRTKLIRNPDSNWYSVSYPTSDLKVVLRHASSLHSSRLCLFLAKCLKFGRRARQEVKRSKTIWSLGVGWERKGNACGASI